MRWIALLRAVNLGARKVEMARLREVVVALGATNVRTLIASGNLVFDHPKITAAKLEQKLEAAIEKDFGLKSEVMARSPEQWDAIVAANPFPKEAKKTPNFMAAVVCKSPPDAKLIDAYLETYEGPDYLKIHGHELYIVYAGGQGKSELRLPKKAYVGTARNWNTVLKLQAMAHD